MIDAELAEMVARSVEVAGVAVGCDKVGIFTATELAREEGSRQGVFGKNRGGSMPGVWLSYLHMMVLIN